MIANKWDVIQIKQVESSCMYVLITIAITITLKTAKISIIIHKYKVCSFATSNQNVQWTWLYQ